MTRPGSRDGAAGHSPEEKRAALARQLRKRAPATSRALLSSGQLRLWFLDQLEPGHAFYTSAVAAQITGPLDVRQLARCFAELVRRHEVLRTIFPAVDGEPRQEVLPPSPPPLPVIDLQAISGGEAEARRLTLALARRPFDLTGGPLLRLGIARLAPERHVLLMAMHHIITDGWSFGVIVREVSALYRAFSTGESAALPDLLLQYRHFAERQRHWLESEPYRHQLGYWTTKLAGAPAVLDLPTDRPRPAVQSYRGGRETFALPEARLSALRALSTRAGVTLYMTVLAAFQALLFRYTGRADIVVGTPIAGRNATDLEPLIGFFVNTLVLRTDFSGDPSFRVLLAQVRQTALEAYAHQDVPFEALVETLQPARSLSHHPVCQVSFALHNGPPPLVGLAGLSWRAWDLPTGTARFDLDWNLHEENGRLVGTVDYAADLFDAPTVRRLVAYFQELLEAVVREPDRRVSDLTVTAGAGAPPTSPYRAAAEPEACVHELFEARVRRDPTATALRLPDGDWTYADLDRRTAAWAGRLRRLGVGPESPVGLCLERSPQMVVAVLAILKAGGAYVPLDPGSPSDRVAFMVEDLRMGVILTQARMCGRLAAAAPGTRLLVMDDDSVAHEDDGASSATDTGAAVTAASPDQLAYVLYTSGSTGRPKGVAVAHRSLSRFLGSIALELAIGPDDTFLAMTTLSFDIASLELLLPLVVGGSVVLAPEDGALHPAALLKGLPPGVTVVQATPTTFRVLLEAGLRPDGGMKLLCGGEVLGADLARQLLAGGARLWNLYGPTEATIWATCHAVESANGPVPIGRSLAGVGVHILDSRLRPVPVGAAGELCIAGAQVARGYLGRPDLTADRFVPDPFSDHPGTRLYRTGDLARIGGDGAIRYLGRTDDQVKLRGMRVELGEIETVLRQHPAVGDAVVLAREGPTGARLVAYVVPRRPAPGPDVLQRHLRSRLPDYMVPQAWGFLDRLPRRANGKIDKHALPDVPPPPDADRAEPPRTAEEEELARIFAEVLGRNRVGVHESFFELGGDSILAIRVVARARKVGLALTARQVFEHQNVAELASAAGAMAHASPDLVPPAGTGTWPEAPHPDTPGGTAGSHPLSPLQRGLVFHSLYEPGTPAYLQQISCTLCGPLDGDRFVAAWQALVQRHTILRTAFPGPGDGELRQVVHRTAEVRVERHDWSGLPATEELVRWRELLRTWRERPFDLGRPPLMDQLLVRIAKDRHRFAWKYHHAILDGWSVALLVEDLFRTYEALGRGAPPISVPPIPYGVYLDWLTSRDATAGEAYWREELRGLAAPTSLAIDHGPGPPDAPPERHLRIETALSEAVTAGLVRLGRQERVTLNTIVQAAWAVLLSRYSGESNVVFGATVSGRPPEIPGVESMVGLFINTLPVRATVLPPQPLGAWLRSFQERQAAAREFEHMPLDRIQAGSDIPRGTPLFETVLVFESYPIDARLRAGVLSAEGLTASDVETIDETHFPITVMAIPGRALAIDLEYDPRRFEEAAMERLLGHLAHVLEQFAHGGDVRLRDVVLSRPDEVRVRVEGGNGASRLPAASGLVHELFEEQVRRTPDSPAASCGEDRLSYGELDARAEALARLLAAQGVAAESLVAIVAERSIGMLIAWLGVLKTGGACLPLDPAAPAERLRACLEDARPLLVLTTCALRDRVPTDGAPILCLDAPWPDAGRDEVGERLRGTAPDALAFVLYTSGSTGRPKGVMLPHRGLWNRLVWGRARNGIGASDRVLHALPPWFDFALWEIFTALTCGARLVIVPAGEERDAHLLAERMADGEVTIAGFVPSMLEALVADGALGRCRTLRKVFSGGEALTRDLQDRFFAETDAELLNTYGPTETSIDVTFWDCDRGGSGGRVPIGRPVANTAVHLLDSFLHPVPIGVPGEIFVGGESLARGYLDEPGPTAERFVPDPFGPPGTRLYRTGDLGVLRSDGAIEYAGRRDEQVKIRGFRIEPGEIETALRAHPDVRECAVQVRRPGGRRPNLVAYVVTPGSETAAGSLREFLRRTLPDYMIPAEFVRIERLPRLPGGKVDRRALASVLTAPAEPRDPVSAAPRTDLERMLASIYAEVLDRDVVGRDDNFFDLGGDSILSLQIVARARAHGIEVTPKQVFEHQTVADVARVARVIRPRDHLEASSTPGRLPLTPIQHWFFEQGSVDGPRWSQPAVIALRERVDPRRLARTLEQLVITHDALRLRFDRDGDGWSQTISDPPLDGSVLTCVDVSALEPLGEDVCTRAIDATARTLGATLGPGRGHLCRFALFDRGPTLPQSLLIVLHHLATDAVSWRLLLDDLWCTYGEPAGTPPRGPRPASSFAGWAQHLERLAATPELEQELDFWRSEGRPVRPLPSAALAGARPGPGEVAVSLGGDDTRRLWTPRGATRARIEAVLLSALAQAVVAWTGDRCVRVDLERHGRDLHDVDVARTVGWLTAIFPVTLEPRKTTEDLEACVHRTEEQLASVPRGGVGYGLLRYLCPRQEVRSQLAGQPPAEISFNFLGTLDDASWGGRTFGTVRWVPLSSAAEDPSHILDFTAAVIGRRLLVTVRYAASGVERRTVEALAQRFVAELQEWAAAREKPESPTADQDGVAPPSRFGYTAVEIDEIERVIRTRYGGADGS